MGLDQLESPFDGVVVRNRDKSHPLVFRFLIYRLNIGVGLPGSPPFLKTTRTAVLKPWSVHADRHRSSVFSLSVQNSMVIVLL